MAEFDWDLDDVDEFVEERRDDHELDAPQVLSPSLCFNAPSPTLSPADPVPRPRPHYRLLTLCPAAY